MAKALLLNPGFLHLLMCPDPSRLQDPCLLPSCGTLAQPCIPIALPLGSHGHIPHRLQLDPIVGS